MQQVLYIYQNYRKSYSSASLSILRGFQMQEKVEVDQYEVKPISYKHQLNRYLNRLPFLRQIHFKMQNKSLVNKATKRKYNLIFVMKGTDIEAKTIRQMKDANPSAKVVCFNPDDPFNNASSNFEILKSIPIYDAYLIWTKLLDKQLTNAGAKKIIYFPFAIDREVIYPIKSEIKYDISFIGNGDTERHKWIKEFEKEVMLRNLDLKLHLFGSNWPSFGDNIVVHSQRNGEAMLKTIAASRINLNFLRLQNKNSINMRTFEIPAIGGFMLHETSNEAKIFFIQEEAGYFSTCIELLEKILYYLNNEKERLLIKDAGFAKSQSEHYTYYYHVKQLLMKL